MLRKKAKKKQSQDAEDLGKGPLNNSRKLSDEETKEGSNNELGKKGDIDHASGLSHGKKKGKSKPLRGKNGRLGGSSNKDKNSASINENASRRRPRAHNEHYLMPQERAKKKVKGRSRD